MSYASIGSPVAIGSSITGGINNEVLYIDSTGKLAQSVKLTWDGTSLNVNDGAGHGGHITAPSQFGTGFGIFNNETGGTLQWSNDNGGEIFGQPTSDPNCGFNLTLGGGSGTNLCRFGFNAGFGGAQFVGTGDNIFYFYGMNQGNFAGNNYQGLTLDNLNGQWQLGDFSGNINNTNVAVDDSVTTIILTAAAGTTFVGSGITTNNITINGTCPIYNSINTVANGIPSLVAQANLVTQGAAIAATTLYAIPASGAGMYRVSWVASITRAATVSSVLGGTNGFQLKFTDPNDSVVKTTAMQVISSAANTTGTTISGTFNAYCKGSTNLQYLMDWTSAGATSMQYDLSIRVEPI